MPYKFVTTIIMYVIAIVVIIGGVQKGLERANKVLIPALFIFLAVLAVRGLMLPGGVNGVIWMFKPDFSVLDSSVIMAALNQCFFLSGVGMATLFTFMDFVAMLITLPIGAILISIYAGTKFWEKYLAHAAQGANYFTIPRFLKFWYIIVLPLVTALVVVVGIAGYF